MSTEPTKPTEWIAVLHGDSGTIKMAFPNPVSLAQGLAAQTKAGWMVASVYEREAETYAEFK